MTNARRNSVCHRCKIRWSKEAPNDPPTITCDYCTGIIRRKPKGRPKQHKPRRKTWRRDD